jgi:hypothetical protein
VGDYVTVVHQLHLKYGPVVRVAPNELAYTEAAAWEDIYGYRVGAPENIKDPSQAFSDDPRYPNILEAPRELHSKVRRLLSSAFSDKCIREQEPIISTYTDILIDRLRKAEGPVDITQWYNVSLSFSKNDRGEALTTRSSRPLMRSVIWLLPNHSTVLPLRNIIPGSVSYPAL